MTHEQRGVVAFKIAGIGFMVAALGLTNAVGELLRTLFDWVRSGSPPGRESMAMAALLFGSVLLSLAAGIILISFAKPLSRRLWPKQGLTCEQEQGGFLRFGIFLIGVGLAVALCFAMLAVVLFRPPSLTLHSVPLAVLAAVLVARPGVRARRLQACMAVRGAEERSAAPMLALGILLICVFFLVRWIVAVSSMLVAPEPVIAGEEALLEAFRAAQTRRLVSFACWVVTTGVVGLYAGRLAVRLTPPPPGTEAAVALASQLSADAWLALAVFTGVVYLSLTYVAHFIRFPLPVLWSSDWWEVAESLEYRFALPIAAGVGALHLGGLCAWTLGAHLAREPNAEPETPGQDVSAGHALALCAEVAVTLVTLYSATVLLSGAAGRALWEVLDRHGEAHFSGAVAYGVAGLTALVALALRGEVAGLFWRHKATGVVLTPARRAAVLHPWLVLMGLWFVIGDGPYLAVSTWAAVRRTQAPHFGGLEALPGLVLLLAAPWVSRRLSYGPLIPAVGRALRRRFSYGRDR